MHPGGADPTTASSDAVTRTAHQVSIFRPGDLLCSRFRVVRFIARGGMGELFEAEDTTLGEHVALKTVRPEIAADARASQRFRREVQLARKVTHASICRIFDLFEHVPSSAGEPASPVAFVTMELLHGETLAQRLQRKGPYAPAEALPIVRQMCEALAAAHAAGIVHRDFKSNNVMILVPGPGSGTGSGTPRVVVTDFGLAFRLGDRDEPDSAITAAGDLVGTPDYMAPEQIEGAPITPQTDVYALGVVLYEMMTGRRPFVADTPMASALQRMVGPPPKSPLDLNPDLPPVWDRTIMRCLARRPEDRFPDAMSVVAALESGVVGEAAATTLRARIPAVTAGLLAAAAVGALVVLGVTRWSGRETGSASPAASAPPAAPAETPRPAVAVLGFRNLAGRDDVQWLSMALSEMLTTELGAAETLRTVPGESVGRMKNALALADADAYNGETLARIREHLGSDLVVSGSYVTVGDGDDATLRVDVRIQDSQKGVTTALVSESGKAAELLDIVSRAGAQLRARLGVDAGAATASMRASQPGTSAAARLYAEGLLKLRRYDAQGARTLFEQAVQSDPKFPLAYSALASAWSALGYDSKAKEAAARAFDLSAGLPRADRLLVEGTFHEISGQWKEAAGLWQTLATFFPDDIEYALRLANAQVVSGAAKEGLATIETFRKRFPAVKDPRLDLADAQAAETLSDFKRVQAAAAGAGALAGAQGASQLVASARLREGGAYLRLGQKDRALQLFDEARTMYATAGDQAGVARAINSQANAISDGPDTARTRGLYDEGLAIARGIGKQDLVANFLNNIAIQERRAGDLQASLKMNEDALAIRRDIGDRTNTATSLNNIGNVLLDLGDFQGASRHYEESAAMCEEIGDRRGKARALFNAGEAFKQQAELARSRASYEESLAIRRTIADPASVATSLFGVGHLAALQGDLATAKRSLTEALAMDRKLDRRRPMAFSIYQLADLAMLEGDLKTARRLHQEALDLRSALGEQGTAAESRAAIGALDLMEGNAASTETLARGAAEVFAAQKSPGNEASARALLAVALLAQGNRGQAAGEIARAQALVGSPPQGLFRLPVAIAAGRVTGAANIAGGLQALEAVRAEAVRRGLPRYEFEARRAAAEIEARRTPARGEQLRAALAADATAKGFRLYAR